MVGVAVVGVAVVGVAVVGVVRTSRTSPRATSVLPTVRTGAPPLSLAAVTTPSTKLVPLSKAMVRPTSDAAA